MTADEERTYGAFSYHKPTWGLSGLEQKNKTEYRINLVSEKDTCQKYEDHTGGDLWDEVETHLKSKFGDVILEMESDRDHHDDHKYIWLHLDLNTGKETIKIIVASLNEKYTSDWRQYIRVPKLTRIIEERFRNTEFLLQSTCEYQRQFGYEKTRTAIKSYLDMKNDWN
jgi:hypothetical protein